MKTTALILFALALAISLTAHATRTPDHCKPEPKPRDPPAVSKPEPKAPPSTPRAPKERADTVDRPCDRPEPPTWCKWGK